MQEFEKYFCTAQEAGLGVTMHIAEVHILLDVKEWFTTPNSVIPDSG